MSEKPQPEPGLMPYRASAKLLVSSSTNKCHNVSRITLISAGTPWLLCTFFLFIALQASAEEAASENASAQLTVANVAITVDIAPGKLALSREQVLHWISEAARAVTQYYGRFPVSQLNILVTPISGRGAPSGTTFGHPQPRIKVTLGDAADEEFLKRDWMMVHEMVHLAFPSVSQQHHWIEEGLATYVEPWARLGIGQLTAETVWKDLVEGLPKGLPAADDKGLDHTPTWGRTYWGGALFCLLADIEIHKRTANQHSLRDALRGIVAAGGSMREQWSLTRALEIGDLGTGVPVLMELYTRMKDVPMPVDLHALWQQLGVELHAGTVVFRNDALLAAVREAITQSAHKSMEK